MQRLFSTRYSRSSLPRPGASLTLGKFVLFTQPWANIALSAEFAAELPASIDNTALQAVPDYRLRRSFAIRF